MRVIGRIVIEGVRGGYKPISLVVTVGRTNTIYDASGAVGRLGGIWVVAR